MSRREWFIKNIKDSEREFHAAAVAVDLLDERLLADPSFYPDPVSLTRAARDLRDHLEGTYLIRLFAAFEAGLRDAWEKKWKQTTEPPVRDLIDGVAARCKTPQKWTDGAHKVRTRRNGLVHQGGIPADHVRIDEARSHLCKFFSMLPRHW